MQLVLIDNICFNYFLDTVGILSDIRLRHIKLIIKEKFGQEAARIFQVLLDKQKMEEKQVLSSFLILY